MQGEFYPVNLVDEIAIEEDKCCIQDGAQTRRIGRGSLLGRLDMFSGKSSDECIDEDDETSYWSNDESFAERIKNFNWETVPETPLYEIRDDSKKGEQMDEKGMNREVNENGQEGQRRMPLGVLN